MGILKAASGNSVWRGLDYYKESRIINYKKLSENEYEGNIRGSNNTRYSVFLDTEHPRKSKCNCPHAKDKRIICKHLVAFYFTLFPREVDEFLKEVKKAEQEYADYREELYDKTIKHINSMSKSELKEALIETLNLAPDWVYDNFVRNNIEF